jgi:hypothetical protein
MSTTLPGVCVDEILWDFDHDRIVGVCGDESQAYGYLCCLEGNSLRALCLDRIPITAVSRILAMGNSYLVAHGKGIYAIDKDDFSGRCFYSETVEFSDLAFDERADLLFYSGTTFLTTDGEVVGKAESPDAVCSIAPRPDGGYLCVSKEGVVSAWDYVEGGE